MSAKPRTLPDFQKPPVIEVVIGVRFKPLAKLSTVHYGLFWKAVSDEYTSFEDHPPLFFDIPPGSAELQSDAFELSTVRRVFMVHRDKTYVIQVQPDRFIHNWRRAKESNEYPHFDAAYQRFKSRWEMFQAFIRDHEIGPISTTQYEVTYINHFVGDSNSFPVAAEQYMPLFSWKAARSENFLPNPKGLAVVLSFELPDQRGLLNISLRSATRATDQRPVLQVELTARGPAAPDASNMDTWLQMAHEWIVRGFTDLTSRWAHEQWERTQ